MHAPRVALHAVITSDTPDRLYSARLRTAVVLTGSGTAGAYQAGVLRALHEAGVRTDLVAGRGIGAAGAMFAAVDGGQRLWEPSGIWKGTTARGFYPWRRSLRIAGWSLGAALALLLFPLALLGVAVLAGTTGMLLTLVGLEVSGSALTVAITGWIARWFAPELLPTVIPRLVLLAVLTAAVSLAVGGFSDLLPRRTRRRTARGLLWRLAGSPMSARSAVDAFATEIWKLIRGAAPLQRPRDPELARRYVELLAENLGQPGFRELLLVVHDLDARQDLVFAYLGEQYRPWFAAPAAARGPAGRAFEAFDLAGIGRDHAIDALAAALAMPLAVEPHPVGFSLEGPWRGETHRTCDRPGALTRLLEEVLAAGGEQVILVSAAARPGRPHELRSGAADLRGRAGEELSSFEAASLRDAVAQFSGRFAGFHVIRPDHNPLGSLDFRGVHDEQSDRRYSLGELVDRGYEDAYRQFIDPVVGASGERIESAQVAAPNS